MRRVAMRSRALRIGHALDGGESGYAGVQCNKTSQRQLSRASVHTLTLRAWLFYEARPRQRCASSAEGHEVRSERWRARQRPW